MHMRYTTYSKYLAGLADQINLQALLDQLGDFLLQSGFKGMPAWWGGSGDDDTDRTMDDLRQAILKALMESGQLTPDMLKLLRGESTGDEETDAETVRQLGQMLESHDLAVTLASGAALELKPSSAITLYPLPLSAGFDLLEPLVAGAAAHLRPEGLLALEIGATQAAGTLARLQAAGAFAGARVVRDLAGRDRVALATRRTSESLASDTERREHA